MQFYLFNIRPKLHHRKLRKCLLLLLFVQPLSGNFLINCQAL